MNENEIRTKVLQEVQSYIDTNNIYQVIFGYYDYSNPNPYYWWHPLQTKRINITEALNADKTRRPTLRES